MKKSIPLTDVRFYTEGSSQERKEFIQIFGKALQEFGFVIVEGHGISETLIRDAYRNLKDLFELPLETKLQYTDPSGHGQRGYVSFGREHAKNSTKSDLKEFWHVGREHFANKEIENSTPKNIWPHPNLPDFKASLLNLYSSLDNLASILLGATSEYLGMAKDTLPRMAVDGNSILRALHYPPLDETQWTSGAVRAAAHEDINLITILCEATESGLEILTREGEWLGVECAPGQMIVDSGDMLSRLTNDILPSTTHRVVNPSGARNISRYSMPFFVHAYNDCELKVLENCVSPSSPAKYPPILAKEFLLQRLKEIGLGGYS